MIARTKSLSAGALLVGVGIAAARWLPPDGQERSAWLQVAGRFHPLAVHLPIGLLLLVPLLELLGATRRWAPVRAAAGVILTLGAVATLVAATLGWILGFAGGYSGDLVVKHMWGGVMLALVCVVAMALRPADGSSPARGRQVVYFGALGLMIGVLTWTGHQGGSLARGETYLVERLPVELQKKLGFGGRPKSAPHPFPAAFYATDVQPLFENNCVVCHGPNKTKGKLQLDSFAHAMKGGEHGPVIAAGDVAGSELLRRITLPHDHKEFMPSEGKKPLAAREVKLLEQWIKFGASPSETRADLVKRGADLPADDLPPPPQTPDFRTRAPQIADVASKLGIHLVPVSRVPTDGLILRTVSDPTRADDAMLAQLAPIAEFIVDAELERTKVTDAGLKTIAGWPNLRRLDLAQTSVTRAGVSALSALPKLEWISLAGTRVDGGIAETLKKFPALRTSYVPTPYIAPVVAKAPEPSAREIPDDPNEPAAPKKKKGKAAAAEPPENL